MPQTDLSRPEDRLGRFRLVGRIARGGMAEIFLGRPADPDASDAGAEFAVKRLLPELRGEREFLDMFFDEANLASRLDHPNVVRIAEVGSHPWRNSLEPNIKPEIPFIAMELLRGVNLRDLLTRLQKLRRRIPIELGISLGLGALRGLSHAHTFQGEEGPLHIVHRDVSPQNVVVTYDGAVKLVDFGVAKAEGRLHHTRAGFIKGKFAYMSPEQVDGRPLDGRSDLFALAEVLYELLLQRHPFYASSQLEMLRKIVDEDPPIPQRINPDFPQKPAETLLRALEKRPENRFESADAMIESFSEWLYEQPRRPTSTELAGLVRELFADRRAQEERARQEGDNEGLVEALRVGRSSDLGVVTGIKPDKSKSEEPAQVSQAFQPNEPLDDSTDALTVLQADPEAFSVASAAEHAANRMMNSHTRATNESSQEHSAERASPIPGDVEAAWSNDEAESRGRRFLNIPNDQTLVTPPDQNIPQPRARPAPENRIRVEPAVGIQGPKVVISERAPVLDPAERGRLDTAGPISINLNRPWTLFGEAKPTDLAVFFVGISALLTSIVFAFEPFGHQQSLVDVRSSPSGAAIFLDGAPTGEVTPTTIRMPRKGSLQVRLHKQGYGECTRVLSAEAPKKPLAIECTLRNRHSSGTKP